MKDWIHDYCMQKRGVEEEFKDAWNARLYKIGGKIFTMHGAYKDGRPLLTVKMEPAFSVLLRAQYAGSLMPGYDTEKRIGVRSFLTAMCRRTLRAPC